MVSTVSQDDVEEQPGAVPTLTCIMVSVMRERTAYQVDRIDVQTSLWLWIGSGAWYLQELARLVSQNVDPEVF